MFQVSTVTTATSSEWLSATGPITIPLTNDYLFRALLQRNNYVLKGLICSLLHLSPQEISSVIINNPIILGESINDKTFFLDISITLNDHTLINLEMQVINEHNWPERSLSYLCRTFDNLNSGKDYSAVQPAIQIGLLDFTLFPEFPEFYSTYQFLNVKNHTIYIDKLRLCVLDLTRIDLATEEDRQYHIDYWASLFKATTWEELRMLAEQNEFIANASSTVYQLSQEETIRLQCEAREDYYRRQRSVQHYMDKQKEIIDSQQKEIDSLEKKKNSLERENDSLEKKNDSLEEKKDSLERENDSLKREKDSLKNQLNEALKLLHSLQEK